jgi:hypothetical protein
MNGAGFAQILVLSNDPLERSGCAGRSAHRSAREQYRR